MTTAIAKKEGGSPLAIVNSGGNVAALLQENFGGDQISPFDLGRVRIPTGGGTHWMVPDIEEEDGRPEKEIDGVVVNQRTTRVYWSSSMEDGDKGPPDCKSRDGLTGFAGEGGGDPIACASCPFNQWGSGRNGGKACKEQKELYVLATDSTLPDLVVLPPSSLKPWKQYLMGLIKKGIGVGSVITTLGLKKVENSQGTAYAQATFKLRERLDADAAAAVSDYAGAWGKVLAGADVVD